MPTRIAFTFLVLWTAYGTADDSRKPMSVGEAALRVQLEDERLKWTEKERQMQRENFNLQAAAAQRKINDRLWQLNLMNARPLAVGSPHEVVWSDKEIYVHAPGLLRYPIPERVVRFRATGGIRAAGDVRFVVRIDGKEVYRSEPVHQGRLQEIDVRIPPGAKTIALITDENGKGSFDQSYWVSPRFEEQ